MSERKEKRAAKRWLTAAWSEPQAEVVSRGTNQVPSLVAKLH